MICIRCGHEIPEGAAFCPNCGEKAPQGGSGPETPLFDRMEDRYGEDLFWLNARQIMKGESGEALTARAGKEPAQPRDTDQTDGESAAYRAFGGVLAQIVDLDGRAEISEAECRAFAEALELSSVTSR